MVNFAREFRYNSGRERYLVRELDPVDFATEVYTVLSEIWTDYDGDTAYGDYTIVPDGGVPAHGYELQSYQPGIAYAGWMDDGLGGRTPDLSSVTYQHTDMIGTLRNESDAGGNGGTLRVKTAFGEHVSGPVDRYGYAGAWGYQTDAAGDFPFLHVGARYYDPAIGRFLQRDPIGIRGGLNVYAYVRSMPTVGVDPLGLTDWFEAGKWAGAAAATVVLPTIASPVLAGAGIIMACGWAAGFDRSDAAWWSDRFKEVGREISHQWQDFAEATRELENVEPPNWKGDCIIGCHREESRRPSE